MVVIKIGDGMGNQMFNYACGYSAARRSGEPLKLDISECDNSTLRDYELDFFRIKYEGKESFPNRNFRQKLYKRLRRDLKYHVIVEKDWFSVDERVNRKYLRDRYLHGYWQNVGYFEDYLEELREMFVPREPLRGEVAALQQRFRDENTCAVHVRGGDINGPKPCYFQKAMSKMGELRPGIQFIIFTNDNEKAAECIGGTGPKERLRYISGLGSFTDKEEFLLMSACGNHIISNSSYSTWAAYLGRDPQQIVILPEYKGAEQIRLKDWIMIKDC